MTMKNSQNIACMDCKKEGAFEFYGHIDVTTDPALKVLVKIMSSLSLPAHIAGVNNL